MEVEIATADFRVLINDLNTHTIYREYKWRIPV